MVTGTHLADALPVRMRIYDVSGRLVRNLGEEPVRTLGRHFVQWDGRSDRGTAVAAGVYLCVLEAGGQRRDGCGATDFEWISAHDTQTDRQASITDPRFLGTCRRLVDVREPETEPELQEKRGGLAWELDSHGKEHSQAQGLCLVLKV